MTEHKTWFRSVLKSLNNLLWYKRQAIPHYSQSSITAHVNYYGWINTMAYCPLRPARRLMDLRAYGSIIMKCQIQKVLGQSRHMGWSSRQMTSPAYLTSSPHKMQHSPFYNYPHWPVPQGTYRTIWEHKSPIVRTCILPLHIQWPFHKVGSDQPNFMVAWYWVLLNPSFLS